MRPKCENPVPSAPGVPAPHAPRTANRCRQDRLVRRVAMAVVVGYVPTAEGRAALRQAAQECRLRNTRLVVINSSRGGRSLDAEDAARWEKELAEVRARLDEEGLEHEVRQLVLGLEPAEDLIAVAEE